jgi:DNA-binding MarR family transcriptional regulator/GNAT superfamily N-acetyltransferase
VIFELAQRESSELSDLRAELDIDAGYLTRILDRLEADGTAVRRRSTADRRRQVVALTDRGRARFQLLDRRSAEQIRAQLSGLVEEQQRRLVGAMDSIRELLGDSSRPAPLTLRQPEPGDFGWVVQRHGALYAEEYGWDETFEALVARVVADYVEQRDPARESAWIADLGGEPVGCVFCVRKHDDVAQLRLLLVEPSARGIGVGSRLVDECLSFARKAGYGRITLWTNDVLEDARRIYERSGFELVGEAPHRSFGRELVGQTWSRAL